MAYFLSPVLNDQQFDANGIPLAGGKVWTYLAGSTTLTATYQTNAGVAHSNPIILDSSGNLPSGTQLWLQGGQSYKFVVMTSANVTLRTIDNVVGVNDVSQAASEWLQFSGTPTYLTATSFSVVGDQTQIFQPNRQIYTINTGGTIYSYVQSSSFLAGVTTVTVVNNAGTLDAGLSAVFYAVLSATNPSVPASYAKLASPAFTGVPTAPTAAAGTNTTQLATTAFVQQEIGGTVVTARQSVSSSSVDANGFPNFLATSANLNLPIAGTIPLVMTSAAGFDSTFGRPVNRIGIQSSNTTLTLAASSSLFIYADIAVNGTVTFGSGTLAPSYLFGGTPSTVNGQFTFLISTMTGYVGNGTTAAQTYRVYLGEATTSGTAVTAVVNYALNGRYISAFTATLPTTAARVVSPHNIGFPPLRKSFIMENTTTELNYAVGDQLESAVVSTSDGTIRNLPLMVNRNSMAITTSTSNAFVTINATTGVAAVLTAANWRYRFTADRGW